MRRNLLWSWTLAGVVSLASGAQSALAAEPGPARIKPALHHDLYVKIDPARHSIAVRDAIALRDAVDRDAGGAWRFVIHAGLSPRVKTPGWKLERESGPVTASFAGINATTETVSQNVPLEGWRLIPPPSASPASTSKEKGLVEIEYEGVIHHPLDTAGEEYQRGFSETPGTIEERGAFLSGTSFWVPAFGNGLVSFDLEVGGLGDSWNVVSQGRRAEGTVRAGQERLVRWSCPDPTEEIYLVAGPWTSYSVGAGKVQLNAFLRTPDPALASKYLEAGKRYLKMYESILPAYPYGSFSLVENFWETGYGMPGFTLLGEKIIRFPFIITSSYPHELLHNWWGNSVYVDVEKGNWCEGLTAYMADHLFEEQRGEGPTYRRTTLQKYADFVRAGKDFPLASFRSRRSAATEAVGYGKSLMIFHMIRRSVGDRAFLAALSRFDAERRFTRASYQDLARSFQEETGADWTPFFDAWIGRAGAPALRIEEAKATSSSAGGWEISVRIRQTQEEDPFPLTVPVAVTVEGRKGPLWSDVPMTGRDGSAVLSVPGKPLRLDVDPSFDLMRRLDPLEVPPALSTLFGEDDPLFVLPSQAASDEITAWKALAAAWKHEGAPRLALDTDLGSLPSGTVWVLGWSNRWGRPLAESLADQGVAASGSDASIGTESFDRAHRSIVLVSRHGGDPRAAAAWVASDRTAAIPGLARKLPHYTRYSYLAFKGDEPENVAKGMWKPTSSPLVRNLSGGDLVAFTSPKGAPLAQLPAAFDTEAMRRSVDKLSSEEMQGRAIGSAGLEAATSWVESRMKEIGLEPAADSGYRQTWSFSFGTPPRELSLTNLVGRIPGSDPALSSRPIVVLAHLDHLGDGRTPGARAGSEGKTHPGADDNASGVSVLLEIARTMASEGRGARPVLFAVVSGEEWGLLGSRKLLESLGPDRLPFACVNLDTVGRLRDGQLYALNTDSAREWRFIFMGIQASNGIPVTIVPEPLDSSDQAACLERGVPAIQLFTGPNADYHRPSDTADRIDVEGMGQVAEAGHETIAYLARRAEPLTVQIRSTATAGVASASGSGSASPTPAAPPGSPGAGTQRRASLGTVPDFAFAGPGVRVQEVLAGSPAEAGGIRAGDVILLLSGAEVKDLKSYSEILKAHAPGETVEIVVVRGGEKTTLRATLGER